MIPMKKTNYFVAIITMFMMLSIFCHSGVSKAAVVKGSISDNSFATANHVNPGDTMSGSITETDELDNYRMQISQAGKVTLTMTAYMRVYDIFLYDGDGKEVWKRQENRWNENLQFRSDTYSLYLEAGVYYIKIDGSWQDATGRYECKLDYESGNTTFSEADDSFAQAKEISFNQEYIGQISINDEYDIYRFTIANDMKISISTTSYMNYYNIAVYNSAGKEVWKKDYNEWNENMGCRKDDWNLELSSGMYYLEITEYYGSTGKYSFSIDKLNQKNCSHDYEYSKTVQPTYFAKGYELSVCKKCGHKKKDDFIAKKILNQGYISIFTYSGKGKVYLRWNMVSDASGYQLRCSKYGIKAKTVKGGSKTKYTFKGLSRKRTYSFQVRAYKKSGNKVVYGKWSNICRIKTK